MTLRPHEVFRVLGVSTRIRILELLKSEGPLPVKTLADRLGITPAAVSQHLKAMRYAGLVASERRGYWVPYSVDAEALDDCCSMLIKVCACTPGSSCRPHGPREAELSALAKRRDLLRGQLAAVEARFSELNEEPE
jgi:DNA-binding transcriptional ArsR family regulator